MRLYPKTFIDELKARSNIVDVMSRYVRGISKRGKSHFACCPFHHEKTPSFVINEYEQYYHCFGCGRSGDVIKFIEEIENIEYFEAVALLAKYANLTLPELDEDSGKLAEQKKKKDKLYEALRLTAKFYHECLNVRGGAAIEYLHRRSISDTLTVRFGLGYSPDYDSLPLHLKRSGSFSDTELIESGAVTPSRDGRLIDAMSGRLVFPIINSYNDVTGFSGRLLEKKEGAAKYKNTGATLIFDKSKSLYGINLLKKEKQQNGINDVILVEGHVDLVSLNGADIKNSVATMGTALTKFQAALIKRYSEKVYIAYDGDKAGQAAALRGLDILADEGLDVKVIELPEGLDPDDTVKKLGREGFLELKNKALPLYEYKIYTLKKGYDMSSNSERGKFAVKAVDTLKPLGNDILTESYLGLVSDISGINYDTLKNELQKNKDTKPSAAHNNLAENTSGKTVKKRENAYLAAVRFILNALLFKKSYAEYSADIAPHLIDQTHIGIFAYISDCKECGIEPRAGAVYDEVDDSAELEAVMNVTTAFVNEADGKKYYEDSFKVIKKEKTSAELKKLREQFASETDVEKRNLITGRIKELLITKNKQ
ncbi:MAG: DNA primase [Clostridiales bacterium]|nr:DNA primase [Clostridiales bacterium]